MHFFFLSFILHWNDSSRPYISLYPIWSKYSRSWCCHQFECKKENRQHSSDNFLFFIFFHQANGSHALMTTLLPRSTFSVWNAASKTYEASWTATTCDMGIQQDINIIITCHTINSGSRCTSDVAYSLTVTECTQFFVLDV